MESPAGSSFRQLQAHLGEARARFKAGEFEVALESIDRALELDPQYLAARALRATIAAARHAPVGRSLEIEPPALHAPISVERFAKFEERARHRRVEHRLQSARQAIQTGQLGAARAVIGELSTLDPDLPDLASVTLELSRAEQAARVIPSRGPWFAAGVALAVALLATTWFETNSIVRRHLRQPIAAAPAFQRPAGLADPLAVAPVAQASPEPRAVVDPASPLVDERPFEPIEAPVLPAAASADIR